MSNDPSAPSRRILGTTARRVVYAILITALIPLWVGILLGLFGWLAISPNEGRRKLFMHINVTIGLLGFLAAAGRAVQSYVHAHANGTQPDAIAQASQWTMASLLLIYVVLCVRSFISARRARLV